MLDAVWHVECILPSFVCLCMEWMDYRFVKERNSH